MNSKNSKDTPKTSSNNVNPNNNNNNNNSNSNIDNGLNTLNTLSSLSNINNINQLPSLDRFKELVSKLEYEYKLLWLENQELKSKVQYLSNINSSTISNVIINNNINNNSGNNSNNNNSNSNNNNNSNVNSNQPSTNTLNNSSNNVIVNSKNKNKSSNSSKTNNIPIITSILSKNSTSNKPSKTTSTTNNPNSSINNKTATVNNTTSTTSNITTQTSNNTTPTKNNTNPINTAVSSTTANTTSESTVSKSKSKSKSKINSGFLIGATGKSKLPKIKKTKIKIKPVKQSSLSKRDGSHKWIRVKEYLGHRDGIWEITGCPWEILYFGTASTDRTARIWTVDNSRLPIVYTGHTGAVNSIRFHPFERLFCTASGDKTVHIVKVPLDRSSHGFKSPQQNHNHHHSHHNHHHNQQQHHHQPPPLINTQQHTSPNASHNIPGSPVMGKSVNHKNNNNNNIPITNLQHNIDKIKSKLWTPLLSNNNNLVSTNNSLVQTNSNINNLSGSGGIPNPNKTNKTNKNIEDNDFDMDSDSSDTEQGSIISQPIIQSFKPPQSPRDFPKSFKILNDDNRAPPNQQTQHTQQTQQTQQNQQNQQNHQHQHQKNQKHQKHQKHQSQQNQQRQNHHHNHQHQQNRNDSHHHKRTNQLHTNAEHTYSFIRSSIMELKGHSSPVIAATWVTPTVIVSSSWDNSIRWWNTETGKLISKSNICKDQLYRVTNVTAQPLANIQCLTSSTDGIIRVWDFRSGSPTNCINTIQASSASINSAIFTSDGNTIISSGDDKIVKVWDIRQSKTCKTSIRCPFSINRLSVSSHGSIAIPQDDGRVSVYDIYGNRKGKMRDQYKYGHKLICTSTSWSFDDSVIYSGSIDRKIIVWAENT